LKLYHASLGVAAVFAIAVLAVPAAQALNRMSAPHHTGKGPRSQIRAAQSTLARATSELAHIRRTIGGGALQGQVLQLQRSLKKTRAQLTTSESALRAPSPLAVANEQVRREVAYVQGGVPYSRGQLISEAALDYAAGHVSDTAYGYLELNHRKLPPPTANPTLRAQAGICTGAALTFAAIVHHFGFPVRSVNFYYDDPPPSRTPDGHVAVEVQYDGGWHFFDPTFGQFWTNSSNQVLSIADVRAGQGTVQKNVAAFTNVFEDKVFGNDAWFITDPTTTIKFRATKLINLGKH
jgi:hypothetical protein